MVTTLINAAFRGAALNRREELVSMWIAKGAALI